MSKVAAAFKFLGSTVDEVARKLVEFGYPDEVATRMADGSLPMDEASRMARAAEQGYESTDFFKGLSPYPDVPSSDLGAAAILQGKNFPAITEIQRQGPFPSFRGSDGDIPAGVIAGFYSPDPKVSNYFAPYQGTATYPLKTRLGRVKEFDAAGKKAGELQFGEAGKAFRDAARSGDYDTIILRNTADEGDVHVSLNASNIRSANAAFDPDYTGPNILGSRIAPTVTAGLLGVAALTPEEAEAGKLVSVKKALNSATDLYRGSHRAPDADFGAPLHDLEEMMPDIYGPNGQRYYSFNNPIVDQQTFDALRKAKGNPNMQVPVYRAVPKGVEDIYVGDWVTTSPEYAKLHGESVLHGDYDILEALVEARKLQSEGYPYELGILESGKIPTAIGLTQALTNQDILDLNQQVAIDSGMAQLGYDKNRPESAMYNYSGLLPIKRHKDARGLTDGWLYGYEPAMTGLVEAIARGLLDVGESRKTGRVQNPNSIWEVLF